MVSDRSVEFAIASGGLLVEVALFVVLICRRFFRGFPFFAFYIGYSLAVTSLGLWVSVRSTTAFFSLYWIAEPISGVLELLVLHEVFTPSLRMEYKLLPWLRVLPAFVLFAIFGGAFWQAIHHPFGQGRYAHFAAGAYAFELGSHILEVVIFAISVRLAKRPYHPLSNPYRLAIVSGLGCFACAVLVPDLIRLQAHGLDYLIRYLPPTAYLSVQAAWLIIFLRPKPDHRPATPEQIERMLSSQRATKRILGGDSELRAMGV